MFNFKIDSREMAKLKRDLKKLGEVPQKHVTASVKKAMNIPLKLTKTRAPKLTGNLRKGLISVGEGVSARKKGKKVYRIVFDRAMNDIFQHKNKSGKISGYYPVSQEYGYFTKSGRYIQGKAFGRKALEASAPEIEKTIVDTMQKKIDKEIAKGGLKK